MAVPDLVAAVHALDAAAGGARTLARANRSTAWQEFAMTLSGLCAQATTIAATAGHTGLLAGSDRGEPATVSAELATASRLLSVLARPETAQPRAWATLVMRVQSAASDAASGTIDTVGGK